MNRADEPSSSPTRIARVGRVISRVMFTLTPVLSLGLGSWLSFLVAAIRFSYLNRRVALLLWTSTFGYFATAMLMVVTVESADGTFEFWLFFGCMVVSIVGATFEALTLVAVATRSGLHGHTPNVRRTRPRRAASGAFATPRPGAAGGPATTPDSSEISPRHAAILRLLGSALAIVALGLMGAMGLALHQYEHASSCTAENPSSPCVRQLTGLISAPGRSKNNSWCNPGGACVEEIDYSIVVTLQAGSRAEVWDTQSHPDFRVGDHVVLQQWKGRYISITGHGHRVEVNGWNPGFLIWALMITFGSTAVAGVLWRVGLLSFKEHSRGVRAVLRTIVAWTLLVVVGTIGSIVLGQGLSAPLFYFRWW
ncbi:MAG: hypothetical protein QG622_3551 [Actinomycetota bacterium]|nr:hypothetical protein [Actinomycetota bacterium]